MKKLQDKVAVVTGGGSGLGKAICLEFAREGAHVVVVDNVADHAEEVAKDIRALGREGVAFAADVTDSGKVKSMADEVHKKFGKTDILVTSAGVMGARTFISNISDEAWKRTLDINLTGGFYCIKAFLPVMMAQKSGRIIMISSTSGKLPAAMNADYSASKHGVIGLVKSLAIELCLFGLHGITANAICPGSTQTTMIDEITEHMRPLTGEAPEKFKQDRIASKCLQQRLLDPVEIAYMAVYLASDDARGITAQAMNVCGGTVLW